MVHRLTPFLATMLVLGLLFLYGPIVSVIVRELRSFFRHKRRVSSASARLSAGWPSSDCRVAALMAGK